MHKEPLIPLGTCVLQRAEPQVACNCSQLLRQWDDLQVHHKLVDEVGVSLSVIHKLEDRLRVLIDTRQQFIIELATCTL